MNGNTCMIDYIVFRCDIHLPVLTIERNVFQSGACVCGHNNINTEFRMINFTGQVANGKRYIREKSTYCLWADSSSSVPDCSIVMEWRGLCRLSRTLNIRSSIRIFPAHKKPSCTFRAMGLTLTSWRNTYAPVLRSNTRTRVPVYSTEWYSRSNSLTISNNIPSCLLSGNTISRRLRRYLIPQPTTPAR